jgi:hypothetical protein
MFSAHAIVSQTISSPAQSLRTGRTKGARVCLRRLHKLHKAVERAQLTVRQRHQRRGRLRAWHSIERTQLKAQACQHSRRVSIAAYDARVCAYSGGERAEREADHKLVQLGITQDLKDLQ